MAAPKDQAEFDKILAKQQEEGFNDRMQNQPPPGMGPDGDLVTVEPGAPRWEPKVLETEDEPEDSLDDADFDYAAEIMGDDDA